jgi:hypothetical protein
LLRLRLTSPGRWYSLLSLQVPNLVGQYFQGQRRYYLTHHTVRYLAQYFQPPDLLQTHIYPLYQYLHISSRRTFLLAEKRTLLICFYSVVSGFAIWYCLGEVTANRLFDRRLGSDQLPCSGWMKTAGRLACRCLL